MTIFTLGMLAFLVPPFPRTALVVPLPWCLVGLQAAFLLGMTQGLGLLGAAAVGVSLLVRRLTNERGGLSTRSGSPFAVPPGADGEHDGLGGPIAGSEDRT